MSDTYIVILAGGYGKRAGQPGGSLPKQFLNINGTPVIIRTINNFACLNSQIKGILVAVPEDYMGYAKNLLKESGIKNILKIIKGGLTRQGSSYNILKCIDFNDDDILVFHDAARPFVSPEAIDNCIIEASEYGASGLYIKATDTIAHIENNFVQQIPDRSKMYYAQTPQAFKYNIIKEAHELAMSKGVNDPTDDVRLVLDAGHKVRMIEGSPFNIKITSPFDIRLAEFIAGKEK